MNVNWNYNILPLDCEKTIYTYTNMKDLGKKGAESLESLFILRKHQVNTCIIFLYKDIIFIC